MKPPSAPPIQVLLLWKQGCHFCHQARTLLERLGSAYPLQVQELDSDTQAGQELAARESLLFAPAIFVEGQFLQHGRPSERKLRARLDQLMAGRLASADGHG